jgi:membrane protein implicated in regulation of membrane protease activity
MEKIMSTEVAVVALRVLSIALLIGAVLLTAFAIFVMTLWSDLGWEPPLGSIVVLFLLCSVAPVLGAIGVWKAANRRLRRGQGSIQ